MLIKELDDPAAPLYLIRLWSHCQGSKGAKFDNLPAVAVAMICEYDGDPEKLNAALINARWLSRDGDSIEVLGWEKHNAQLIANWENGRKGGRPRKNSGSEKSGNNPSKTHGIPMANPTQTDKIREDKRREDKNDTPPPKKDSTPLPKEAGVPLSKRTDKGNPIEGNPKKVKRFDARTMELPDHVPKEAWQQWAEYRASVGKKISKRAATMQFNQMKGHSKATIVSVIEKSIASDYQGLFFPKFPQNSPTRSSATDSPFEPFYCSLDKDKKRPFAVGDKVASWNDGTYETIESFVSQSIVKTKSGKTIDLTDYRLEQ